MLYIFDNTETLQAILKPDTSLSYTPNTNDTVYFIQTEQPSLDDRVKAEACPYHDAVHTEKLNDENSFTFSVPGDHQDSEHITEGNLVAFRDLDSNWQLFEIKRVTDTHGGTITRTAFCEHAYYELVDDFIQDIRPTNCSAHFALTQALSGTRWEPGDVNDLGTNSTNYYYQSALSSVQKVASVWEGELQFRINILGGVIANRYVDLLARRGTETGKQFAYGRHTRSIEREVDLTTVATALCGRGKGEEVGEGYGRRLTFSDVVWSIANGDPVDKPLGQEWVGDPDALAQWGRPGNRHRVGTFEDTEETDPEVLLQKTWDALQECKTPNVTYNLDVADLERLSGLEHEKVRLGDTVRVIDRKFSPELLVEARVIEIDRNLLNPLETKITLGNFAPTLSDDALEQQTVNQTVRDRQGVWDRSNQFNPSGTLNTSWLEGIIDTLQNEVQAGNGTVTVTDNNGILIVDNSENPTKALRLLGGLLAISNEKDSNGNWVWRSFGDGDGFTADEIKAGEIQTSLIKISGNSYFYWDGDYLYIVDPSNGNRQIRLSKEGIKFTTDGGQSWGTAIDFDGVTADNIRGNYIYGLEIEGGRIVGGSIESGTSIGGNDVDDLETTAGAQAKADVASSAAASAQTAANNAQSTANTANSTANAAKSSITSHSTLQSPHNLPSYCKMQSDGFKVFDMNNILRCIIGQHAPGKYGVKVSSGEIYSSTISTGAEGAGSRIDLLPEGGLEVYCENYKTLELWPDWWYGRLRFYDAGEEIMEILSSEMFCGIETEGDFYIDVEGDTEVMKVKGNCAVSKTKNCIHETKNYGRRFLSARESPEVKFVDEGAGRLENGVCRIDIDPIFLECIEPNTDTTPWLVHLTPYFRGGVYVSEIGEDYFIVREIDNEVITTGSFTWSLTATRQGFTERFRSYDVDTADEDMTSNWEDEINA